ncbi:MAG: type II secretion system F family protein [Acidobacteria bacterium]|nr:type II secretion system F family protein [Acidobacteriota bacterium]
MPALFLLIFVVLLACVILAIWLGNALLAITTKSELVGRLQMSSTSVRTASSPIFIETQTGAGGKSPNVVDRLIRALQVRASAAGTDWSGGAILATSLGLAALGALLGWNYPVLILDWFTSAVLAAALGSLPLMIITMKRSKRLREFEEQFAESLDFIARALRAGHAFSVSLEMLAAEAPLPSRDEWRRVFREHNLGSPLETALIGMTERVPLVDVKFFVSAVILQREAGGNLSEILTNLAATVRDRFRLKGHVLAATAHARITAIVLSAIPLITLIGLRIRSPYYLNILLSDRDGQMMLAWAFISQIIGYAAMRKVINIKV